MVSKKELKKLKKIISFADNCTMEIAETYYLKVIAKTNLWILEELKKGGKKDE